MIPALFAVFLSLARAENAPPPPVPFDLSADHALTPEERTYLLGLESSRYRVRGPNLEDTRTAGVLSVDKVTALLRERSKAVVSTLEDKEKSGRLSDADHSEALVLLWYRGALLPEPDREFLQRVTAQKAADPSLPKRPDPYASLGQINLGVAGDALLDRMRPQLVFDDHGDPAQRAALEKTLSQMMQSPFARRLSEDFLKEGAKVKVSFDHQDNSSVVEDEKGRKYLQASGGYTAGEGGVYHVSLNEDLLKTDPYYNDVKAPATLGHELLGHALAGIKSDKAGARRAFNYYDDDETQAGLVGWIVATEIGREQRQWDNGHMWNYVASPQKYHEVLQTTLSYYAGTFNSVEMKDPVPVLKARLARASEQLADAAKEAKEYDYWKRFVAHMIQTHDMKPEGFKELSKSIADNLNTLLPQEETDLQEIQRHVKDLMGFFQSRRGKASVEEWRQPAVQGFLDEVDRSVASRRAYLENLLKGRGATTRVPRSPPAPGQVTWAELEKMLAEDREKNPGHFPLP